ncbi:IclR family transcriptional regulator [Streptomyces pratens]|uniref:IclR family transcriptional regulator n=1 Tax=Streptomyces pratens TaxID=887456 RepID=A0ABW1M9E0_9ACTN
MTDEPAVGGSDPLEASFRVKPSVAVSRALALLDAFLEAGHTVSVTELAQRTGIPKSTAFRILVQLTKSGHVIRSGNSYRLGLRMFELGNHFVHARPDGLRDVAAPLLGDLFLELGAAVGLSVLDGSDVILIDQVTSSRSSIASSVVGVREDALTTASGKAMLAFVNAANRDRVIAQHLELSRRTRHTVMHAGRLRAQLQLTHETCLAYTHEEYTMGEGAIASPVLVNGRPIAAVSVSAPSSRIDKARADGAVLRTARLVAGRFIRARELAEDYGLQDVHWDMEAEFPHGCS